LKRNWTTVNRYAVKSSIRGRWSYRLEAGQRLRIVDFEGQQAADFLCYSAKLPIKPDHTIDWLPLVSKAGDYVEIKAVMDCIVVMSACSQDIVPINALNPLEVEFTVLG
jgi:uncharacterized protein YcgI (DUF1989 family)